MAKSNASLIKVILLSGLLVGTLDMTSACINGFLSFHITPVTVFRYIASAIQGKDAFTGGTSSAILGVVLHYIVAYIWTILFFLIYPYIGAISKYRLTTGFIYGVLMWCIMNLVIVPMTSVAKTKHGFNPTQAGINAMILICVIAIPLSYIAGNYYDKRKAIS